MTIGIYALYFPSIDKIYIGQSQNIEQRFIAHKSLFKRGHYNYKLKEAYTSGEPEYTILINCSISELNTNEIYYINEFNSIEKGLNITHGGNAGIPGYTSGKCKNSKEELELAFNLLAEANLTKNDVMIMTNVSYATLNNIISGSRHSWLHEYYPNISLIVKNNKSVRSTNAQQRRFSTNVWLLSPEGIEYHCTNRNKFAKEHSLNSGHLGALIREQELHHKGWKLIRKEVQQNE